MIRKYLTKVPGMVACVPLILAGAFLGSTGSAFAQNHSQCASAATDPDGDGWGYENGRSCLVAGGSDRTVQGAGRPICSASAFDNGDGWGWENDRSCIFAAGSSAQSSASSASASSSSTPVCTSAAINNGDGWGWENDRSCIYSGSGSSNATTSSSSSNNNSSSNSSLGNYSGGAPQCSARAIDNGNGWGFEYGASCIWGDVQPGAGLSNDGAAPPPIAAAKPGYDNATGRPICLTDSSDGNGDGFGYEDNQTCKVVSGVTATPNNPLLNQRWCQPWAEISYGDYVLQNNTWNDSDVFYDTWSQCIELGGSRGNYVAKWDYDWLDRTEGNEYSVKSYPQVYYGRKTRNTTSGTPERLGLPAMINNIPEFKVRYRYSETGNAERNVALESFFHTSCEAEEWNKHFEMMVWVNVPVTKTPGKLVAEATIDGKEWLVYTNPALSWGYVAFVEKTPSYEGTLNWSRFVDWTRNVGPSKGVWDIGNTCMGAIEIGTETFWGTGTFTLHEFKVYR
jgi:hypothetical protein